MTALVVQPDLNMHSAVAVERLTPDDLRELMQSVTEVTQRLQTTHVALHEQVARLQRELAEANAALSRSQSLAALGEMAAGIAHEVRNPLGSIQLYVRMLAEDLADRPAQASLCHKIEQAVMSLDAIVRDVLSFARETTIHREPATSTHLFARALELCASLITPGNTSGPFASSSPGRAVAVLLDEEPSHSLHADIGLMTQALGNVIRNAIEAMVEAGTPHPQLRLWTVRKRMRCSDGRTAQRTTLCVQDNGPGVPDDVRERIFNPFFTTRSAGTGLGLAIVHRIVDAHGGHVVIENVKPTGTRVELCLPVKPETAKSRSASTASTVI